MVFKSPLFLIYVFLIIYCSELGYFKGFCISQSTDQPRFLGPGFYVKHCLKEIPILKVFSFEDKDPRFTRLKPVLALRLLSKGLFYIRAMEWGQLPPCPPNPRPQSPDNDGAKMQATGDFIEKAHFSPTPSKQRSGKKSKKKVRGNRILATAEQCQSFQHTQSLNYFQSPPFATNFQNPCF